MPTYEFKCEKCKKRFSLMMTISEYENKKIRCPKCKSVRVKQQITSFEAITSNKSYYYTTPQLTKQTLSTKE